MPKVIASLASIVALSAFVAAGWATERSLRREKEIRADAGSIRIDAGGVLNTTVNVYDGNDIAKAALDYDLIEDHRQALLQLGFSVVHIETAKGETLDKSL